MRTKEELREKLVRDLKNQIHREKTKRMKIRGVVFYALGIIGLAIATYNYQLLLPASRYIFWIFIFSGWLPIIYNFKLTVSQAEIDKRFDYFYLLSASTSYITIAVNTDVRLHAIIKRIKKVEVGKGSIQIDNIWRTLIADKKAEENILNEQTNDILLIDEIKDEIKKDLKS